MANESQVQYVATALLVLALLLEKSESSGIEYVMRQHYHIIVWSLNQIFFRRGQKGWG
jgi:hypothetical protein